MSEYKLIEIKFDQAQMPKFEEKKGKGWIEFGKDNDYPEYLLSLYNESPKHGTLVKSKANYVFGKGFEQAGKANSKGDTWNDVLKRCVKDDELYRGFYLQVIYNRIGQVSEIYHIEFHKVRVSKDMKLFYVKNDWKDAREKPREYKAFNPAEPYGAQIFYYKEYNPSSYYYPVPSYIQGLNMIEADIQVSRHILGNAKQGWVGSKLVQLNNGNPPDEQKEEVERGILKKFTGSEGRRTVIMFNPSRDNNAEITDLGTSMLTKEDFTNVNNLIQQEIFVAHQIISPILFGVKTEGQLGGRSEIRDAYEIFNNVYVSERQGEFNAIFTKFRNMKGEQGEFKIQPVEPLKFEFTEGIMAQNLSKDEIRQLMGKEPLETEVKNQAQIITDNINSLSPLVANKVLESMSPDEIRGLAGLEPTGNNSIPAPSTSGGSTSEADIPFIQNDAIKNLSGRQYQNIMRIVRNYGNGKLTKEQATLMLRNGFGLSDSDVNAFLGIDDNPLTDDEIQKFSEDKDERLIQEFANTGDNRDDYVILSTRKARDFFADQTELNQLQANILGLIEKDKRITPQVIARTLDQTVDVVNEAIADLIDSKILSEKAVKVGPDEQIERRLLKPLRDLQGKDSKVSQLFIRYSYEWKPGFSDDDLATSRPFCKKMIQLSRTRIWSRAQIEQISERLGYSVFDRKGGWYGNSPECRHRWVSQIVKKIN